jgi:hypothetical protein
MDEEHRNVRVWGGVHFRNSLDVGYDIGKKIVAYLIDNSLKPVRRGTVQRTRGDSRSASRTLPSRAVTTVRSDPPSA